MDVSRGLPDSKLGQAPHAKSLAGRDRHLGGSGEGDIQNAAAYKRAPHSTRISAAALEDQVVKVRVRTDR